MSLMETVRTREMVDRLCAEIDAGRVTATEEEMLAIAVIVKQKGGLLAHDLLCKLASRCRNGRAVLRRLAH